MDMYPALPGVVTCGSWLREALALPQVQAVYILGLKSDSPAALPAWVASKLEVYPYFAFARAAKTISEKLAGQVVYISLDKDVLASPFAWTNWEQGKLAIPQIFAFLRSLRQKARIIGMDVCGEICPSSVVLGPMEAKRIEANEEINLRLVALFKRDWQGREGMSA